MSVITGFVVYEFFLRVFDVVSAFSITFLFALLNQSENCTKQYLFYCLLFGNVTNSDLAFNLQFKRFRLHQVHTPQPPQPHLITDDGLE